MRLKSWNKKLGVWKMKWRKKKRERNGFLGKILIIWLKIYEFFECLISGKFVIDELVNGDNDLFDILIGVVLSVGKSIFIKLFRM